MRRDVWFSRIFLVVVFAFVAWQSLAARMAEATAWSAANELRSAQGCAAYLAWASELDERTGPLAWLRATLTPWVSPLEKHLGVINACPAPVDGRWSR